jgi:hypothetical protein
MKYVLLNAQSFENRNNRNRKEKKDDCNFQIADSSLKSLFLITKSLIIRKSQSYKNERLQGQKAPLK